MPTRNLLKVVWDAFIKSFKVTPQRILGEYKGEDYLGNKYYELQADPRGGRARASRWFESNREDLDQDIPPEWASWLRRRRDNPPTHEEIVRNLATSKMKKENASKKMKSQKSTTSNPNSFSSYPTYGTEYDRYPGENEMKDR